MAIPMPPPMHSEAIPVLAFFSFRTLIRVARIRDPLQPIG